jgi:adenosylmethionine-8-amino-7-oxononanoate aminotransferase
MYAPVLIDAHHIDPCYAYRNRGDDEDEEAYGIRAAEALRAKIEELGPDTVIAFVAETVVGATLGAVPPAPGYFRRIREICDEYGILLILDEVMCGMGRTGSMFAFEQEGIRPDIVTIAKGLGAGYQPLGAVMCTQGIFDAIAAGSGFFQHGHTYMGHPTACAAGLAVQRKIADAGLLKNVRAMGDVLDNALHDAFGNHPNVGDIRGRGLFRAIELVADRATKTPFDPALRIHAGIKAAAMSHGMVCYPMGGTVDGIAGDHVLLAPPFIVNEQQIGDITGILQRSVADVLSKVRE